MRFELAIDSMPTEFRVPSEVSKEMAKRVVANALGGSRKIFQYCNENTHAEAFKQLLVLESERLWCRSMNAIDFRAAGALTGGGGFEKSEHPSPRQTRGNSARGVAHNGTASTSQRGGLNTHTSVTGGGVAFAAALEKFAFVTALTKPEAVTCLSLLRTLNLSLTDKKRAFDVLGVTAG